MKLNQKATASALGTITALVSFICVVLIAIIPIQTMNAFGWLIHINNLAEVVGPREVTLLNALSSIITFFIIAYIIGWLFAVLYNKFGQGSKE